MKNHLLIAGSVLLLATAMVVAEENLSEQSATDQRFASQPSPEAKTQKIHEHELVVQQYSYAIGLEIGSSFRSDETPLDAESLLAGLRDSIAGKKPKYDTQTCGLALQKLRKMRTHKMENKMGGIIAQNRKFLEDNAKKEGVKTLPSGLQYKVLKSGDGPTPTATDVVKTHYRGTLIDGTEFDSSYARNQPATFPVNRVIGGWTEALQLMKVGDQWQLFIPSELGYGESGAGRDIPPHATLIFEIELLGIEQK